MQTVRTVLLAGAAAVLLSAICGMAAAQEPKTHVMTIRLPGGGLEEIHYSGNVAPRVIVSPEVMPGDLSWPAAVFGPDSAFAEFDRISAAMDRQVEVMLRNAQALAAEPGVTEIDAGRLPPGASYSLVSTLSGDGMCGKSVEITSRGDGQKPQVVSKSWGDCGKAHGGNADTLAPPPSQPSDVREIRYDLRAPAPSVRQAGLF